MQIKKFYGKDAKEALEKVRQSLGENALIISNKPHEAGVEIRAAIESDEEISSNEITSTPTVYNNNYSLRHLEQEISSLKYLLEQQLSTLVWGNIKERKPIQAECAKRLLQNGFSDFLVQKIIYDLNSVTTLDDAWILIKDILKNSIRDFNEDIAVTGGMHAFWGTSGTGKTSTILKLSSLFALNNSAQHIALISTDTRKIGAIEQLKVYSKILDIPTRLIAESNSFADCVKDFSKKKLILIDNSGLSFQDSKMQEQYLQAKSQGLAIKNHLLLPANYQYEVLQQIVKAFMPIGISSVIVSKIDETNTLGAVCSVIAENNLAVSYVTDGQHIPDDIKKINAKYLVERALSSEGRKKEINEELLSRIFKVA